MRIHKLNKSGVMARYLQLDPAHKDKFALAKDSSYLEVFVTGLHTVGKDVYEIELAAQPSLRGGRIALVEVDSKLHSLGTISAPSLLREGMSLSITLRSKEKDLLEQIVANDMRVRLTLINPELI